MARKWRDLFRPKEEPVPPGVFRTPDVQKCPRCGVEIDALASMDEGGRKPRPNDFTICIGCAGLNRVGEDMALRIPTMEEMAVIAETEPALALELAQLQLAVRVYREARKGI